MRKKLAIRCVVILLIIIISAGMVACQGTSDSEEKIERRAREYYLACKDTLDTLFGEHTVVELGRRKSTTSMGTLSFDFYYYQFTIEYEDKNDGKTYQFSSECKGEVGGEEDRLNHFLGEHVLERLGNALSRLENAFPGVYGQSNVAFHSRLFENHHTISTIPLSQSLINAGVDFSHFDPAKLHGCPDSDIYIKMVVDLFDDDETKPYGTPEDILTKCVGVLDEITMETTLHCAVTVDILIRESRDTEIYYDYDYYYVKGYIAYEEDKGTYTVTITEDDR